MKMVGHFDGSGLPRDVCLRSESQNGMQKLVERRNRHGRENITGERSTPFACRVVSCGFRTVASSFRAHRRGDTSPGFASLSAEPPFHHLLLRADARTCRPPLHGFERHLVNDSRKVNLDSQHRIGRQRTRRPALFAECCNPESRRFKQRFGFDPHDMGYAFSVPNGHTPRPQLRHHRRDSSFAFISPSVPGRATIMHARGDDWRNPVCGVKSSEHLTAARTESSARVPFLRPRFQGLWLGRHRRALEGEARHAFLTPSFGTAFRRVFGPDGSSEPD